MQKSTHFTAKELAELRKNAVLACADYELAVKFNEYLDANGIERSASESWSAGLIRKLRRPLHIFPIFSVEAK